MHGSISYIIASKIVQLHCWRWSCTGQWIESVTDWAIRITDWGLFPDWVSSHARLADPIRPMPNKGKSGHSGLPIALISRLPDWVVQSVLPIAIHRLLHRLYPLASPSYGDLALQSV